MGLRIAILKAVMEGALKGQVGRARDVRRRSVVRVVNREMVGIREAVRERVNSFFFTNFAFHTNSL